MNIIDLNDNLINWHLTGYISKGKLLNKSSLHLQARKLIVHQYPTLQILEEVPIPLRKSETLYLDFYLPLIKTCIEVHGEQHFKFVSFYHNNILNFLKAKKRDQEKQEWCEKNDIKYISLAYNESIAEWEDKIKHDQNS
jgi:hypothetical protein